MLFPTKSPQLAPVPFLFFLPPLPFYKNRSTSAHLTAPLSSFLPPPPASSMGPFIPSSTATPAPDAAFSTIEASLRSCSLHLQSTLHPIPGVESVDPQGGGAAYAADLTSDMPLPGQWQQFLDVQTGEIYFINMADGTKAIEDPRLPLPGDHSDSDRDSVVEDEDDDDATFDGTSISSSSENGESISSSSPSSSATSESAASSTITSGTATTSTSSSHGLRDSILVLIGCRFCLTYFMVEKPALECPHCRSGHHLVHFGG